MRAEQLRAVRAKIESGWTQGALARRKSGHEIEPRKASACRFCLLGAIDAALSLDDDDIVPNRERIAAALGFQSRFQAAAWNDLFDRTQAEVLGRIDRALSSLDTGEQR